MVKLAKVKADNIAGTELAIGGVPVLKLGKASFINKKGLEVEGSFNCFYSKDWEGDTIAILADGNEMFVRGIVGIRPPRTQRLAKAVGEIL